MHLKKKVSAQKMGFCQNIPTRFWASFLLIFWIETFFSNASRKFSVDFTNMFKVSERSAQSSFLRQSKNRDRTSHQSDFMLRKLKKVEILKIEAQNRVGIFWQNPIFSAETFFQSYLENFLLALRTCSRYLKGTLNQGLCVSKKSSPHHAPIKRYPRKTDWVY